MSSSMKAVVFVVTCGLVIPGKLSAEPTPGYGPDPKLPAPTETWIPTIKWSVASEPWPTGATPKPAAGLQVRAFAQGLKHPRWLLRAAQRRRAGRRSGQRACARSWSPRAIVQNWAQRRSGSIAENANRISLLRDADGDGVAETQTVFLEGLRQPFGMALVGDKLYVANTDSVVRFPFRVGETRITDKGTKLLDLPVGHHWTRALLASADGSKLFVTVGSGSNIGEKGMDIEKGRATILELDLATGSIAHLRLRPAQCQRHGVRADHRRAVDRRQRARRARRRPAARLPDLGQGRRLLRLALQLLGQERRHARAAAAARPGRDGHHARLCAWAATRPRSGSPTTTATQLPEQFRGGMFIGQHGSWNRTQYSGYKVVFVPFKEGTPSGPPIDVLTGFLKDDGSGKAYGRPVGVAVDGKGALLVADDTGNTIWRVTGGQGQSKAQ